MSAHPRGHRAATGPSVAPSRSASVVVIAIVCAVAMRGEAQEERFLGSSESVESILTRLSEQRPRRVRQVGTSSVTLRLDLGDGLESAFKPRTRTHPRGYLAEIAAYRIARALGMDNVPPVIGRRLPRPILEERFESAHTQEDWAAIREDIRWDAPGLVRGAAIYWVPRMRPSELETARDLSSVAPWLSQSGEVPAERASVARDLSTMIAFDYLIGNWDRWSGGNVSTDQSGERLFVRDHNVAFIEPMTADRYERLRGHLQRVERFSRVFVQRVGELDEARLRLALAEDPESAERPVLDDTQIAAVLARRRALLSYVGALVEVHGRERVLAWP